MVLLGQVYYPCRGNLWHGMMPGKLLQRCSVGLLQQKVSRLVSSHLCRAEAVAEAHRAALLLVDTSAPRWKILFCNTAFAHLIEAESSAITALPFWDQFVTEVSHCCLTFCCFSVHMPLNPHLSAKLPEYLCQRVHRIVADDLLLWCAGSSCSAVCHRAAAAREWP